MKKNLLIILIATLLLSFNGLDAKQKLSSLGTRGLRDAKMKLQQKDYDKALEFYLKVLETDPDCIEALVKVGQINYMLGSERSRDAVKYFMNAHDYYTRSLVAYDKLLAEGLPEKKIKDETKLIDDVKKEVNYPVQKLVILGKTSFDDESYDEALEILQKVLELDSTNVNALKLIAQIYITQEKNPEAISIFNQLKTIVPTDTQNLQVLASLYYNTNSIENHVEKAIETYQDILAITPNDIDILFNISTAYSNLKQYDKSLEMNERILAIEPNNPDALDNSQQFARLEKQRLRTEDNKEAEADAMENKEMDFSIRLVNLEPTNENLETLCYTLSQAEKWDNLLIYSQKWYELAPTNQNAIQMVLLAALRTDNKAIQADFAKKLKALSK
ncbi:MAG: tetratricopeptide repeat protein [Candidatus Cloacimonetes bacterium]|nr:tetratricopeptide repeat protein [Candidatus Cloacimonadota bacterium]